MWKSAFHRVWLAIVLASFALLLLTVQSWCRLMSPPSMADVRQLAERAPLVFRGHVLTVTPITTDTDPSARVESIAKIEVDAGIAGRGQRRRCFGLRIPEKSSPMVTIASISVRKH